MKNIQPFIQSKTVVLHRDASIRQAARAMAANRIGCVMVADHVGHIVGIVTDRDLMCRGVAESYEPGEDTLDRVMTPMPVSVDETADLRQVISQMEEQGVRRIPVIHNLAGGMQKCVGVVTLDDLLASRSISIEQVARIVCAQLKRKLVSAKLPAESQKEREIFLGRLDGRLNPDLEFLEGEIEQLATLVLGTLARRLHHTGALRLIDGLPAFIQPALVTLATGPDDTANLAWLRSEVCRLFSVDERTADNILERVGAWLTDWYDEATLEHVKAQLPEELGKLLSASEVAPASGIRRKRAA